jgi:hypothetical protein
MKSELAVGNPQVPGRTLQTLDANEAATIGQCGSLWPDGSSSAYLERPTKLCVASYRPIMAPHMAPSEAGGGRAGLAVLPLPNRCHYGE